MWRPIVVHLLHGERKYFTARGLSSRESPANRLLDPWRECSLAPLFVVSSDRHAHGYQPQIKDLLLRCRGIPDVLCNVFDVSYFEALGDTRIFHVSDFLNDGMRNIEMSVLGLATGRLQKRKFSLKIIE